MLTDPESVSSAHVPDPRSLCQSFLPFPHASSIMAAIVLASSIDMKIMSEPCFIAKSLSDVCISDISPTSCLVYAIVLTPLIAAHIPCPSRASHQNRTVQSRRTTLPDMFLIVYPYCFTFLFVHRLLRTYNITFDPTPYKCFGQCLSMAIFAQK